MAAVLRRLLLLSVALLALAGALWWWSCFPFVLPEGGRLSFRWYHRLPEYRAIDTRLYFDRFGFAFGKGWLGGMEAGRGDFMYRYWAIDLPYWFCGFVAGVLSTLTVICIRRFIRRARTVN
jgi:hypothetical protein